MSEQPAFEVRKFSVSLPMSDEMAMLYGLVPDTRPPLPPVPRRTRLRWWLSEHRPVLHFGRCNHDDC